MGPVVTVVLPALCFGLAYVLGRRELRLYREGRDGGALGYSRSKLVRRFVGVGILGLLGVTFAALAFAPPRSAQGASRYVGLIVTLVVALLLLPLLDVWELSRLVRRKRPGDGVTRR